MTKERIKKTILENRDILRKYKVKAITLFGSYTRNEQEDDSDIDFLVDLDKRATLFDIVELQDSLSGILGKKVSIVSRRGLNKYIAPYILSEAEAIGERL